MNFPNSLSRLAAAAHAMASEEMIHFHGPSVAPSRHDDAPEPGYDHLASPTAPGLHLLTLALVHGRAPILALERRWAYVGFEKCRVRHHATLRPLFDRTTNKFIGRAFVRACSACCSMPRVRMPAVMAPQPYEQTCLSRP
jgi:hypothetical protein